MKTNDHLKHDYQAGNRDWDKCPWEEKFERNVDEMDNWGSALLAGIVFAVLLIMLFLVLALLSPEANAWDRLDNDWSTKRSYRGNVTEMDLGRDMRTRSGTINGRPYNSTEMDLGGGIRTETGRWGDRRINCTTMDLGGGMRTTNCW